MSTPYVCVLRFIQTSHVSVYTGRRTKPCWACCCASIYPSVHPAPLRSAVSVRAHNVGRASKTRGERERERAMSQTIRCSLGSSHTANAVALFKLLLLARPHSRSRHVCCSIVYLIIHSIQSSFSHPPPRLPSSLITANQPRPCKQKEYQKIC